MVTCFAYFDHGFWRTAQFIKLFKPVFKICSWGSEPTGRDSCMKCKLINGKLSGRKRFGRVLVFWCWSDKFTVPWASHFIYFFFNTDWIRNEGLSGLPPLCLRCVRILLPALFINPSRKVSGWHSCVEPGWEGKLWCASWLHIEINERGNWSNFCRLRCDKFR